MYVPQHIKIPDKVCIVYHGREPIKNAFDNDRIPIITFSDKILSPPTGTLCIVDNYFTGEYSISKILDTSSSFYANLYLTNILPSQNFKDKKFGADIKYWSLNEIFLSGVIKKGGVISGVEFVAVTYSGYSTLILKDGDLYKKIKGII